MGVLSTPASAAPPDLGLSCTARKYDLETSGTVEVGVPGIFSCAVAVCSTLVTGPFSSPFPAHEGVGSGISKPYVSLPVSVSPGNDRFCSSGPPVGKGQVAESREYFGVGGAATKDRPRLIWDPLQLQLQLQLSEDLQL